MTPQGIRTLLLVIAAGAALWALLITAALLAHHLSR